MLRIYNYTKSVVILYGILACSKKDMNGLTRTATLMFSDIFSLSHLKLSKGRPNKVGVPGRADYVSHMRRLSIGLEQCVH